MSYDKLDNNELLRFALDAMNGSRDAEATNLLKTLLERDPLNVHGHYLLAALHAQIGMVEQAEAGFRRTMELNPAFPMARFQLAQLLLIGGQTGETKELLQPLAGLSGSDALGAYARALIALCNEDRSAASVELQAGLACQQEIPALEQDMRRLLNSLSAADASTEAAHTPTAPIFMTGYGKGS